MTDYVGQMRKRIRDINGIFDDGKKLGGHLQDVFGSKKKTGQDAKDASDAARGGGVTTSAEKAASAGSKYGDDTFDISKFMSHYDDFARTYLFNCKIDNMEKNINPFLVKATKLPEHTLAELEADWQGLKYTIASSMEKGDFNITFYMDKNGEPRREFVKWSERIHDPEHNVYGNPKDYMKDITLTMLNGQNKNIIGYHIIGAWPKSIGEVTLDYSTKEIATFDVTFAYQFHKLI